MARFFYTQDMIAFIEQQFKQSSIEDTTSAFNKKFGLNKTARQIKATISNHGIKCGRKNGDLRRGFTTYTPEMLDFLRDNYPLLAIKELTKAFNKHFDETKSLSAIKGVVVKHGILSGRDGRFKKTFKPWNKGMKGWSAGGASVDTRFKKGHRQMNYRPVGSTRTCSKDGYLVIKTADPSTWRFAHLVLWEKHNGKVPDDCSVTFRDNDKTNVTIENLMLIKKSQSAVMAKMGLRTVPAEAKESAMLLADLKIAQAKAMKRLAN